MVEKDKIDIGIFAFKKIDGELTEQENARLVSMLEESPEAIDLYVEIAYLYSSVIKNAQKVLVPKKEQNMARDKIKSILLQMEEVEYYSSSVNEPDEPIELQVSQVVESKQKNIFYRVFDRSVYFAAMLMIALIIYANVFPPQYSIQVATVRDQIDVEWAKGSKLDIDEIVLTNQLPYQIDNGIVKVEYYQGVEVLIEGPAKFSFERAGMFLEYGRIYSRVSESGIGFKVDTPTCQYVDLGTEFGVKAELDRSSEIHVVKGKVQMFVGGNKGSITIRSANARQFDANSGVVKDISFDSDIFVRNIESSLGFVWRGEMAIDLADIVGGGNGFKGGELESGIDIVKGEWLSKTSLLKQNLQLKWKKYSDNKYRSVSGMKFVDGVFVPDSSEGKVQITSKGHCFEGFEVSGSGNQFWNNICNGAWHQSQVVEKHNLSSQGKTFGTEKNNSAINIHSNQGITFDLNTIRQSIPGRKIVKFVANAAVSETVLMYGKNEGIASKPSKVDFWFFLDGELLDKQEGVTFRQGLVDVEFEIKDSCEFLTLVVTESDDGSGFDWAFLANPELVLE